jgi:hypothetical protein
MALKADGTVWAWGNGGGGELGNGRFDLSRSSPGQVPNLSGIIALAGRGYGLALKSDGTVWAWGSSNALGDGSTTGRATAGQVPGVTGAVAITGGIGHCLALKLDGSVWAWGSNTLGQLGDGTFGGTHRTPGPVLDLTGVVAISAGSSHSFARRGDGTVLAWGYNIAGQLGDGTVNLDPPYGVAMPVPVLNVAGNVGLATTHGEHSLAVELAAPYSWSGVLQPVNADGTSVFKRQSTVEVKFRLTDASAGITNAAARFSVAQINSLDPGKVNETVSNGVATPGILFRYDPASGEYRFNWRTTGFGVGRYRLRIDLGDGVTRTVVVGLK